MKTSLLLLLFVCLSHSLLAQAPAPTPEAAEAERQQAIRRALDAAYTKMGATNPAALRTNGPASLPPPTITPTLAQAESNIVRSPSIPVEPNTSPATNMAIPSNTPATTSAPPASAATALIPPPTTFPTPGAATTAAAVPRAPGTTPRPSLINPAGRSAPSGGPPSPRPSSAVPPAPGTSSAAATTPSLQLPPPTVGEEVATLSSLDDPSEPADDQILAPGVIRFLDADLLQVLEIYQELTGRTVLRPASLPAAKISIRSQTPLTRRQAVQALDSVLSLNGITMIPRGDLFVKAVPFGDAPFQGAEATGLPAEILPESGSYVTHIVQLKNTVPSQIVQALQPLSKLPNSLLAIDSSGILVLRDYAENVKRMMELLSQIDVVPIQEFEPIVIPIKYALAGDIAQVLSSLTEGGGGATTVGASQSRTGLTGPGGGLSTNPGGAGSPYNPNQQQNRFGTQGAAGAAGAPGGTRGSFQDRLRSIVNRASQGDIVVLGQTKIIADERTNSLLIFASKQDIATIRDIIDKLDVVLPQVIIEAIIMEVSLGDSMSYGVSYLQKQPTASGNFTGIGGIANKDVPFLNQDAFGSAASNALGGGFTYFARFGNDLEATARAMASDSRVNVLSRPRIQTSHAVEANLFIGQTRPYVTGTYFGFSGQPQTQFQQQQIGITLTVLPLINPEGLVVMDIRQKIQSIGRNIQIDANFSVPETIDREANAKVSVRDRETVILGGFISNDSNKEKSGVPILKDIPILGNLFRSQSRTQNRNELIVLIKPTVLPTPEEAAIVANEEKSKLPGIVAAERDFSQAERKRQLISNKDMLKREGFSN